MEPTEVKIQDLTPNWGKAAVTLVLGALIVLPAHAQQTLLDELHAEILILYQQGRYAEAAKVAEEALKVAENTYGPDHPNVVTSVKNVADLYQVQGNYAAAEPLFKRALAIQEKNLGPDHPDLGRSMNDLAVLYKAQGKY